MDVAVLTTVIPDGKSRNDIPNAKDLNCHVVQRYAVQWEELGVVLGLRRDQLECIAQDNRRVASKRSVTCCRAMLEQWLRQSHLATWGVLDDAIKSLTTHPIPLVVPIVPEGSCWRVVIPEGKSRDDRPILKDLIECVFEHGYVARWVEIGIVLGISYRVLDNISSDKDNRCSTCCREMLAWWIDNTRHCTWDKVDNAIRLLAHPVSTAPSDSLIVTIIPVGISMYDKATFEAFRDLYINVAANKQYAAKWMHIGVRLGLQQYELDIISKDHVNSPYRLTYCCMEMLKLWLHNAPSGLPLWGELDDVIRSLSPSKVNKLLQGMIWTTLTCSAGLLGYAIGNEMATESIGAVAGGLSAMVTGKTLIYLEVIQWAEESG